MNFEHDYLTFDEFGIKEVRCMCCATPIKTRQEIRSQINASVIIRDMAKHADYREIPILFSDQKVGFLMVCADCSQREINFEGVNNQIKNAMGAELKWEGKSSDLIQELLSKIS